MERTGPTRELSVEDGLSARGHGLDSILNHSILPVTLSTFLHLLPLSNKSLCWVSEPAHGWSFSHVRSEDTRSQTTDCPLGRQTRLSQLLLCGNLQCLEDRHESPIPQDLSHSVVSDELKSHFPEASHFLHTSNCLTTSQRLLHPTETSFPLTSCHFICVSGSLSQSGVIE